MLAARSWKKQGLSKFLIFVSPLCHPVTPFKRLHAQYLSALCQRVTLYLVFYVLLEDAIAFNLRLDVVCYCGLQDLLHFFPNYFWSQHLHFLPVPKQLLIEIVTRHQSVLEDAPSIPCFHFIL